MIKRFFPSKIYKKIGCPDIGTTMFFKKSGKKIWGKIEYVDFKKGGVMLGLSPFKGN